VGGGRGLLEGWQEGRAGGLQVLLEDTVINHYLIFASLFKAELSSDWLRGLEGVVIKSSINILVIG
jgi:hypothetical protein